MCLNSQGSNIFIDTKFIVHHNQLVSSKMPRTVDHSGWHVNNDNYNPPEKRDSDLLLSLDKDNVTIRMPESRMTRSRFSSSPPMKPWPRRIAQTYNENPVGSFAGNFDKPINLNIRAGNTILSFCEFVEFSHDPVESCNSYEVDMVKYFEQDDVSKMKSLVVSETHKIQNLSGPASVKGKTRSDLDKIMYSCKQHGCVIPCVCYLCNDDNPDECEHKIVHPGFFNSKEHLFTVRNADNYDINLNEDDLQDGNRYCTNRKCRGCVVPHRQPQRSFNYRVSCVQMSGLDCLCKDCPYCKSLDVLKYAGTLQSCESCKMKLIQHESYHLVYHYMCLFCRESLLKFKNILTDETYWEKFDETRFEEKASCHFCNRMFFDKQTKQRHIEIVHNKNPDVLFKCNECDRAFGSRQALNYHIDSYHENVDLGLMCGICEKTFKMDQNLDQHMREVHSEITYECGLCMSKFTRQSNLNHHYKIVHDTAINSLYVNDDPTIFEYFECTLCNFISREKRTVVHHEKFVHRKDELEELLCPLCQFKTYEKKTLNRHEEIVHRKDNLEKLLCSLCPFTTYERKTLNHHEEIVHRKDELEKLSCPLCTFTTYEKKTLNRHEKIVHKESEFEYTCNFCNFRTKKKGNLKRHNDNLHPPKPETFRCDECDYKSNQEKHLERHVKSVHSIELKCKVCNYQAKSIKQLRSHIQTEHGTMKKQVRPAFKCDRCEYRTLDEHMYLVHSNSEHLKCEKCGFKTISAELMNLHKTTNHKYNMRKRKFSPRCK